MEEISKQELEKKIQMSTIIDNRPIDAYNGWRMQGEKRGGHIKGAKSLPFKYLQETDWKSLLEQKIGENRDIIVYGYDSEENKKMAEEFEKNGYTVSVFNGFKEWSESESAMEKLPKYDKLIYAEWLKDLIENKKVENYPKDKFVVCHASYGNAEDYLIGHIPGAIYMDTMLLESPKTWNRLPSEELRQNLLAMGIASNTTVIVYGRHSFPKNEDPKPGQQAGHLGAMRCAAILLYAGVEDVRVLNGGLKSWEDKGYDLSKEPAKVEKATEFGAEIPSKPDLFVDTPKAKEIIKSEKSELVSMRSWNEIVGKVSGYNYIEKAGRIPGSVWGDNGSDAYHMENYRNYDHTMLEFHEVKEKWHKKGIIPDKHIAFYCGTGWRGSEAFFHAYLMDWPKISVYDGGWFEWSNDPKNPVETGEPNK